MTLFPAQTVFQDQSELSVPIGALLAHSNLTKQIISSSGKLNMENSITTSSPHVSRGRLDEIGMGDPVFTAELIDIMLEDGTLRVQKIRAACHAGYQEEVGKLAHSLKGAALNVGALALANLCASIDESVRKLGTPCTGEQIGLLEQEFADVAHELSQIKGELTA